jgi:hypothetical protein
MRNLVLILILLFVSCDTLKNKTSNLDRSNGEENIETKLKRVGDTVSYKIPRIKYVDTTVYTTNRQGTTIKTVYDERGQISNIDCFASVIEEIRKENRRFQNDIEESTKDKKVEQNFDWIIYIVCGFVVVMIVAMILFFIYIKSFVKKQSA